MTSYGKKFSCEELHVDNVQGANWDKYDLSGANYNGATFTANLQGVNTHAVIVFPAGSGAIASQTATIVFEGVPNRTYYPLVSAEGEPAGQTVKSGWTASSKTLLVTRAQTTNVGAANLVVKLVAVDKETEYALS